jgi:hypothetical protein
MVAQPLIPPPHPLLCSALDLLRFELGPNVITRCRRAVDRLPSLGDLRLDGLERFLGSDGYLLLLKRDREFGDRSVVFLGIGERGWTRVSRGGIRESLCEGA